VPRLVVVSRDRVVVVGAGLGGLSAAIHLAAAGREVTVVERASQPGGHAGALIDNGYTFDTGPSVLTMPQLLDETFAALGESRAQWLPLMRLEPAYRATFADGSVLDVLTDPAQMAEQIRSLCGAKDADGYLRFVAYLKQMYRLQMPNFIDAELASPRELLNLSLFGLIRRGALRRLAPKVGSFMDDDRLRRLFTFQALYAGVSPLQALSVYSVISYMDTVNGVFAPQGGMHAIATSLANVAQKHGVSFLYNTEVCSVDVRGERAQAVLTSDGGRIEAEAVVLNTDADTAYRTLFAGTSMTKRRAARTYSPSCVVLHTGTTTPPPPGTAHHTISFGHAWRQTFEEILQRGEVMSDPSILVSTPSLSDPTLAAPGGHTQFALFPTPNLHHRPPIDWTDLAPRYRDHMVQTLVSRGFTGFAEGVEATHLVTPAEWQRMGCPAGTPFALAHTLGQTGPFRPAIAHPSLDNVVFCGASTRPGVGVPMVLISGRLAARRLLTRRLAPAAQTPRP